MKNVVKLLSIALSVSIVLLSFAGCSKKKDNATKTLKIGVLQYAVHPSLDNCYTGIIEGLKEAGYVEDSNLQIDFQNANGNTATSDLIAGNMSAKNYDLIIAIATPAVLSAISATQETNTPIIFAAVSDPVGAKFVTSLDKPGGKCTGSSDVLNLDPQLKMIRAFQPNAKKLGVLYTTSESNSISQLKELKSLAGNYGFQIVDQGIQNSADIPQAATSLAGKVDCITNFTDNNVVQNLSVLVSAANTEKIPVYGSEVTQVEKGCIASVSLDYVTLGKETGKIAARVLNGGKPADIPVYIEKNGSPVVNPTVASSLGLTIPSDYSNAKKITSK